MRFVCPNCKTRYRIEDSKIAGKLLQIRCKSCSKILSVKDPAVAGTADFVSIVEAPEPEKIWYAEIDATRVGPMTIGAVQQQMRYGLFEFTTLFWISPMENFLLAGDIP